MSDTIYFIGNESEGPVKIGFTGGSVESRLRAIQTGSPVRLSVLGSFPGTFANEQQIHAFLQLHRLNGEWFEREPALCMLDAINILSGAKPDPFSYAEGYEHHESKFMKDISLFALSFEDKKEGYVFYYQMAESLMEMKRMKDDFKMPFKSWLDWTDNTRFYCLGSDMPDVGSFKDYVFCLKGRRLRKDYALLDFKGLYGLWKQALNDIGDIAYQYQEELENELYRNAIENEDDDVLEEIGLLCEKQKMARNRKAFDEI